MGCLRSRMSLEALYRNLYRNFRRHGKFHNSSVIAVPASYLTLVDFGSVHAFRILKAADARDASRWLHVGISLPNPVTVAILAVRGASKHKYGCILPSSHHEKSYYAQSHHTICSFTNSDMSSSVSSVALPSLLWRRREANSVNSNDSEPVELAHTPTWPAHLPLQAKAFPGQPQPNLYLQLAQILEWEIWTHNQTRGQLTNEKDRCAELEARICQISDELSHWQKTCQDAYKALDEHRQEHGRLCQELHTAAAERGNVQAQNRKVCCDPIHRISFC